MNQTTTYYRLIIFAELKNKIPCHSRCVVTGTQKKDKPAWTEAQKDDMSGESRT